MAAPDFEVEGPEPPTGFSRTGVRSLVIFATIVVMVGIAAAARHWKMRSNAGQVAKTNNAAVATGNSRPQKVTLELVKVDSEETSGESGYGENAVDGDPATIWHTQWQGRVPGLPHEIIIELLPPCIIKGFTYLPRQDQSDHGTIKDYEFYVSDDGRNFGQPVKNGSFEPGKGLKTATFAPIKCSYIKLRAISEINGLPYTSAAEIGVIIN